MSFRFSLALLFSLFLSQLTFAAARERVLYSFPTGNLQGSPHATLVFDPAGNLYGTSGGGGAHGRGSVFMLVHLPDGRWRERTIYSFTGGGDGGFPFDKLTPDHAGNFFGTAEGGGTNNAGVVFELTPNSDGSWSESVLYSFPGGTEGDSPIGGVIFDSAGNLYGTTSGSGTNTNGTVFELSPAGGGWTETTLHEFSGGLDGREPESSLVMDAAGNLFGTTFFGGTADLGTAFEMSRSGGSWKETILVNFTGPNGIKPGGSLIFDPIGNLYGTTTGGGAGQGGTVFKLSPAGAVWNETLLHQFSSTHGGSFPFAELIFDSAGNLYGTAGGGGAADFGTVFKLVPNSGGWTLQNLHTFKGLDGAIPFAGLVLDSFGNIYGTTVAGGAHQTGSVFEIVP